MKAKLALLLTLCLAFAGCESGDVYHNETIVKGVSIYTDYIDANANEWSISGVSGQPGCYLYHEYKFPEITNDVINKGAVLVYLVDGDGRDNILPYVYPVDNGMNLLMQNIRYEVEKGILTIVIESQDFVAYNQNNYKFKVCILQP